MICCTKGFYLKTLFWGENRVFLFRVQILCNFNVFICNKASAIAFGHSSNSSTPATLRNKNIQASVHQMTYRAKLQKTGFLKQSENQL